MRSKYFGVRGQGFSRVKGKETLRAAMTVFTYRYLDRKNRGVVERGCSKQNVHSLIEPRINSDDGISRVSRLPRPRTRKSQAAAV